MLRNMEYVYEVYKQGNFTKAAKSLYVKPALPECAGQKDRGEAGISHLQPQLQSFAINRMRTGIYPLHRADARAGK